MFWDSQFMTFLNICNIMFWNITFTFTTYNIYNFMNEYFYDMIPKCLFVKCVFINFSDTKNVYIQNVAMYKFVFTKMCSCKMLSCINLCSPKMYVYKMLSCVNLCVDIFVYMQNEMYSFMFVKNGVTNLCTHVKKVSC